MAVAFGYIVFAVFAKKRSDIAIFSVYLWRSAEYCVYAETRSKDTALLLQRIRSNLSTSGESYC